MIELQSIEDEILETTNQYQIAFYCLGGLTERLKLKTEKNELYVRFVEIGEEKAAEIASKIFWIKEVGFSKIAKDCFKRAYPESSIEIPTTLETFICEYCFQEYSSKTKKQTEYKCPDCKKLLEKISVRDMPDSQPERAEWIKRVIALRKLSYQEYLKTDWWKYVRQQAHKRYGGKCMLCSNYSDLHVHHNSYDRLGCERYDDLILLCKNCHAKFHGKDQ